MNNNKYLNHNIEGHHYKGMSFFNKENDILYVNIPKCASTSIRKTISVKWINWIKDSEYKEKYSFTVIREPIKRIVSGFFESKKRGHTDCRQNQNYKYFHIKNNIDSFIQFLEDIQTIFFDAHITPQVYFIEDENKSYNWINDFLIFEKLNNDWNIINNKLKNKKELKFLNKTRKSSDVIEFLNRNEKYKKLIEDIYFEDFKLYNNKI